MANGITKSCDYCNGKTRDLFLFKFKQFTVCGGCFQRMQQQGIDKWAIEYSAAVSSGKELPRMSTVYG